MRSGSVCQYDSDSAEAVPESEIFGAISIHAEEKSSKEDLIVI